MILKTGKELWDTIEKAARDKYKVDDNFELRMVDLLSPGDVGYAKIRLNHINTDEFIFGFVEFDHYVKQKFHPNLIDFNNRLTAIVENEILSKSDKLKYLQELSSDMSYGFSIPLFYDEKFKVENYEVVSVFEKIISEIQTFSGE